MKKNILDLNLKDQKCTGCSICSAICPTKAISIELTTEGFYEPMINDELCVECGLCKKSCYKFDGDILQDDKDYLSYSAINKNNEELKTATSGGVSNELMKACINNNYKVVGVAYDYKKDIAVTRIASQIDELEQFKGSKYFQSYTIDAFKEILKDKSEQKYAVFGTPCQIYALRKYLENVKKREKFLLVDIFCHGCPSLNLWKKYLDGKKQDLNIKEFDKIDFRSKVYGWHEYAITFHNDNNEYYSKKLNDPFYEIFFDKNVFNEACYECKIRSTFRYTDIRIGDFWGYQYDNNRKGVSAVVIASEIGKELFKGITNRFYLKEYKISDIVAGQSYGKIHSYNKDIRNKTLSDLSSNDNIEKVYIRYIKNYPLKKKLKKVAKNTIKRLPSKIYLSIKQIKNKI